MSDLTTFQMTILYIFSILIFIGIFRIIFGLGDYLSHKAHLYRVKVKILKNRHRDLFNKWYD